MQEDREKRNKIQEEKEDQKDRRVLDKNGEETAERTTDIAPVQQKYLYDFFGRKRLAPTQATVRTQKPQTQNRGFFSWFGRRNVQTTTKAPYVAPTTRAPYV